LCLLALTAVALSGCATPIQTVEINTSKTSNPAVCRVLKPVQWGVDDTVETQNGIRQNNAKLRAACRR
jgi:hypothetical protein